MAIAGARIAAGGSGAIVMGVGTGDNVSLALGKVGGGTGCMAQPQAKTSTPRRHRRWAFLLANTRNHP
jgi:hypothetical protein